MKFLILLLGGSLVMKPAYAGNISIDPSHIIAHQLNQNYPFTGATTDQSYMYAVLKNQPTFYARQVQIVQKNDHGETKKIAISKFVPVNLDDYLGGYSFNLNPQGIATCSSDTFYLVNENMSNLIKIDTTQKLINQLSVRADPSKFDDYRDKSQKNFIQGFIGISADCNRKILYVAKRQTPNKIFVVDFSDQKNIHVVNAYDFGSDTQMNISDLSYFNGLIYVLQKNVNRVLAIRPLQNGKFEQVDRYDYSAASSDLTVHEHNEDVGTAEGLVVNKKTENGKDFLQMLLFLDSKNVYLELKI